jgi:hypothetical protein
MEKVITLTLDGRGMTVDVGRFYFQKFYGEATGSDPLNSSDIMLKPEKQFDWVVATVYAGLLTDHKVNKKEIGFTKQDVQDWIGALTEDEVVGFIRDYQRVTTVEQGEELTHLTS